MLVSCIGLNFTLKGAGVLRAGDTDNIDKFNHCQKGKSMEVKAALASDKLSQSCNSFAGCFPLSEFSIKRSATWRKHCQWLQPL